MKFKEELAAGRAGWKLLTLYQKFEHAVILLLTALIAIVVAVAVWNLALKVGISIISSGFDPTDYEVFQAFFGMIFTVIIALEFKRSLLVVAERRHGVEPRNHRCRWRQADREAQGSFDAAAAADVSGCAARDHGCTCGSKFDRAQDRGNLAAL